MNITSFLNTLAIMMAHYFPEEMEPSLKPIDSAGCIPCRKLTFDFIIVGAGSAGCVMANRLSENPEWKVLLIEAGGDENYITDTPALSSILGGTKYDWNYTTVKQDRACYSTGGHCHYPAGHVMGGTSTINGMDYVRGNAEDFNEWEAMGNAGWSYKDVLPYFLRSENMTSPELHGSPYHAVDGPQTVGYSRFKSDISQDFIMAATQKSFDETDYNGQHQIGVSNLQFTLRGPTRCSTSKAYLDPIRNRKNLFIFKNTDAIRILVNPETKTAEGVKCRTFSKEYNVYARKEVIVSAGVMNTPKLLMLSGVGPREHLKELGIPVYADLPVGQHFVDHSGLSMYFNVNQKALHCCTPYTDNTILEYARDRKGELASPFQEVLAFLNLIPGKSAPPEVTVIMGVISQQFDDRDKTHIFVYIGNINPKSRGSVKLTSSQYGGELLVDPNYFQVDSDMAPIRQGIRRVLDLIEAPSMSKYSLKWNISGGATKCNYTYPLTDEALDCFIKYTSSAGYHGVGTARMGPASDKNSVVGSDLRVHTLNNLRVVDASVMPRITRGNTNAPTIMIAEKAADIIKNYYTR